MQAVVKRWHIGINGNVGDGPPYESGRMNLSQSDARSFTLSGPGFGGGVQMREAEVWISNKGDFILNGYVSRGLENWKQEHWEVKLGWDE